MRFWTMILFIFLATSCLTLLSPAPGPSFFPCLLIGLPFASPFLALSAFENFSHLPSPSSAYPGAGIILSAEQLLI